MIVNDISNNITIPLKYIQIGDCFKHSPKLANSNSFKDTYMRIMHCDPIMDIENVSCVNLTDGKTCSFDPDVMVIPVSAKVTIENLHLNTEDDLVDEVDNLERR